MEDRIKTLQKHLVEKNIDVAFIFSLDEQHNTTMAYLTGYHGIGVLAVLKKSVFLLAPEMEYEKALSTGLKVFKTEKKRRLLESLILLLKRTAVAKAAIEESKVSVALFRKLKKGVRARYTDLSPIVTKLRMAKDDTELSCMKKACGVTDSIFKKIISGFRFKTEAELRQFILDEFERNECEPAFPPIVASAEGSSQPHYDKLGPIKSGFLLLDYGAKYKGYCSDMTRTIYLGKPSKEETDNYNLVLNTVLDCEKQALTKKKYSQLYELAITVLGNKAEFFTHSLGHGIGLDIHESPSLNAEDKNTIEGGVPFTIEPGIYFIGKYGIRIEDTVVIKGKKLEVLTRSPKELITLEIQ